MASSRTVGLGALFSWNPGASAAGMARTGAGLRGLETRLHAVQRAAGGLIGDAARLGAVGTSLFAGWMYGVREASKFERQLSAVGAVTRATNEEMAQLRDIALRAGKDSIFGPTEVARAMEQLGKAHFGVEGIRQSLRGVLALEQAHNLDPGRAGAVISDTLKAFNLKGDAAGHVADVLTLSVKQSTGSIQELANALKYAAPSAVLAGKGIEETVAAVTMLTNVGIKGTLAGTAVKNVLLRLGSVSKGQMKELGGAAALRSMTENADGTLKRMDLIAAAFIEKARKRFPRSQAEQAGFLSKIFGLRGLPGLPALVRTDQFTGDTFKTLLDDLRHSSEGMGFAAEVAARKMNNLDGDSRILRSHVEALNDVFQKGFEPVLRGAAKGATRLSDSLFEDLLAIGNVDKKTGEFVENSKRHGGVAGVLQSFRLAFKADVQQLTTGVLGLYDALNRKSPEEAASLGGFLEKLTVGGPLLLGLAGVGKVAQWTLSPLGNLFSLVSSAGIPGMLGLGAATAALYDQFEREKELNPEESGPAAMLKVLKVDAEKLETVFHDAWAGWRAGTEDGKSAFDGWATAVQTVGSAVNKTLDLLTGKQKELGKGPDPSGWFTFFQAFAKVIDVTGRAAAWVTGKTTAAADVWGNQIISPILGIDKESLALQDKWARTEGRYSNYTAVRKELDAGSLAAMHQYLSGAAFNYAAGPLGFRERELGVGHKNPAIEFHDQGPEGGLPGLDSIISAYLSRGVRAPSRAAETRRQALLGTNPLTLEDVRDASPNARGEVGFNEVVDAAVRRLHAAAGGPTQIRVISPVTVTLDGRSLARAQSERQIDLADRSGTTPSTAARVNSAVHGQLPAR